jgi:hypothetical protein
MLPRLSPKTAFAYRLARVGARDIVGSSVTPRGLMMRFRFDHDVTAKEVPCELQQVDGVKAIVGPVAEAFCPWEQVERAEHWAHVVRAEPTLGIKPLPPSLPKHTTLDVTGVTRAVEKTWPLRSAGAGVTVGDMDSGFDPFHPLHFKADGGRFQWIDVDGDGVFTPGIDAVDANHNGMADPGETVGRLPPTFYSEYTEMTFASPTGFTPGVDWLYQDENGNGKRDYGKQFTDAKLTYGEQLYVADDVNGDGVLQPGEPLVALATPRVKALLSNGHVYKRGVDLSQYPVTAEQHASMVLGTLAGGDALLERYHGVAPDIDLVMSENDGSSLVQAAAWAKEQGSQIMIWEMANWFLEFLDGSSAHEQACDSLVTTDGILQLGAAGNLTTSEKHFRTTISAGSSLDLPINVPGQTPQYLIMTLLWRGTSMPSVTAKWGTASLAINGGGQAALGPAMAVWEFDTSSRGTHKIDLYLTLTSRPAGAFSITVDNTGQPDLDLIGFLEDPDSSWGVGVAWTGPGVTDVGNYGTPAVGDHTLAIATWMVDWPYQSVSGDLAFWSGQGPRLDGMDTIDFATPEDHWTAPYADKTAGGQVPPFGSYFVGGGTSNATPMATGIAAVLLSANPTWKAADLTTAMNQGAAPDSHTGTVPNDKWGKGKLSAYRALTGMDPPAHTGPTAVGTAVRLNGTLMLDASASTGDGLQYQWDVGVDGELDVPASTNAKAMLADTSGAKFVELDVGDSAGFSARVVVPIVDEKTADAVGWPEVLGSPAAVGCSSTALLPCGALALAILVQRSRRRRGSPRG